MKILIKNGRVIDPANKTDRTQDILVEGAKIAKHTQGADLKGIEIIDAKGMVVAPGLIDMHVHARQPGREDAETLVTASRAAAKGGFTTIAVMPNTEPACDNSGMVEYVISESKRNCRINVLPIGAITKARKGEELAEMADMRDAGAIAFSDDGFSVKNAQVMRRALEYANMLGALIISHCEELSLSQGGAMNEGLVSTLLGLRGSPNISESTIVARDIALAALTGTKLHIAHISTRESIAHIKAAKAKNIKITCETCPHYFTLTEEAVKDFDTSTKVNPPLRAQEDKEALIGALKDGTIDVIATDHAPHTEADKDVEFDRAPSGMIGLETALALSISELLDSRALGWVELIEKLSYAPSKILNLPRKGSLAEGNDADIVIIDPNAQWVFGKDTILSKSKNSPFIGRTFKGRAAFTICGGEIVYKT